MPVYLITGPEDERRLVNAKTKSKAVAFVVNKRFAAEAITTSDMVDLMNEGLKVEDARDFNEEPVQAEEPTEETANVS